MYRKKMLVFQKLISNNFPELRSTNMQAFKAISRDMAILKPIFFYYAIFVIILHSC